MKKFFIVMVCMLVLSLNVFAQEIKLNMVNIPGSSTYNVDSFEMLEHEVTLDLYVSVMGEQPENLKETPNLTKDMLGGFGIKIKSGEEKKNFYQEIGIHDNHPVVGVSFYDVLYFCNLLSVRNGLTPVYSVDGKTDVNEWNYEVHKGSCFKGEISSNEKANGYRLPTTIEWTYVNNHGETHAYPGSDNVDEVAWYKKNSNKSTNEIKQKKTNNFGLYDLAGNVAEFTFSPHEPEKGTYEQPCECNVTYVLGGSFNSLPLALKLSNNFRGSHRCCTSDISTGFRIVKNVE